MDFTPSKRRNNLVRFMKTLNSCMNIRKKSSGEWVFRSIVGAFNKSYIASGVEGAVYKGTFRKCSQSEKSASFVYDKELVIKEVKLKDIVESKDISKQMLDATPSKVYRLFLSERAFNKPSLVEIIAGTLVNQLVLQGVCPNFVMNYFWEYEDNKLLTYNEFASGGDLHKWAQQDHSVEEWFNLFFQVVAGLISMQHHFGMMHTDFHSRNILVHKVQPGGYWKYIINDKSYYVPNLGFVALISDFGFAWIPDKLHVGWHYKDTLRYTTNVGKRLYDFVSFIQNIGEEDNYKVPGYFLEHISKCVSDDDMKYTMTKRYHYRKQSSYRNTSQEEQFFKMLKDYPKHIRKDYEGTGSTLQDILHTVFSSEFDQYDGMDPSKLQYLTRPKELERVIAIYDVNKPLDQSKFPVVMSDLVIS
jgi:hypothetical protein